MNQLHLFLSILLVFSNQVLAEQAKTIPSTTTPATENNSAIEGGKQLHDVHCLTSCHNVQLYTRQNRKIKSYNSLETQVQRCVTSLNKQWFEEEVKDVATYLNTEFYKFKETTKAEKAN
jgi:hypothetical protein